MADEEMGDVAPDDDIELVPLTEDELQALEAEESAGTGAAAPSDEAEAVAPETAAPPVGVPNHRSPKKVFWYQVLSGTLYGVYWFFRNYKQFALHKKLKVKPALLTLVLYTTTGAIITVPNYYETTILIDLVSILTAAGIYGWFFYRQFLIIDGFLAGLGYKYIYSPKRLVFVLVLAFLFPIWLTLFVRSDTPLHFMGIFFVAMLICAGISGWVLSKAQVVLNFIWASHQRRTYNKRVLTPVSLGEKIFIGALCVIGVSAVLTYFSGAVLLFTEAPPAPAP